MNSDYFINAWSIFGIVFIWIFVSIIYLGFIALSFISIWKIFVKAEKPGWAALIPIYNIIIELEIIGRPWWFILLMFVPLANFVVSVIITFDFARVFGKGIGFGFGLFFLPIIFYPILAFSNAKYIGPQTT